MGMVWLSGCFRLLYEWLNPEPERPPDKPWLIDRDGTVYKPERRVVLKAKD
jgi:hypothetical protein